jgi:hypothetical protein
MATPDEKHIEHIAATLASGLLAHMSKPAPGQSPAQAAAKLYFAVRDALQAELKARGGTGKVSGSGPLPKDPVSTRR